jgi:hypothetical protein
LNCLSCQAPLEGKKEWYALKLELTSAFGPLEISPEELATAEEELKRLLELVESLSQKQIAEEQARIFCRRFYPLCRKCRDGIFRRIFLKEVNEPEH